MKKSIFHFLSENPGSKARDIANALEIDKTEVNRILYSLKTAGSAEISDDFKWQAVTKYSETATPTRAEAPTKYNPTQEQLSVIRAPASAHIIVEAGPGTGKTETLANRVRYLVGEGGLSASNVVVLSFSVAAVKELRKRIEADGKAGAEAYVEIRTFDSFASRLLRRVLALAALSELSYDERIVRATKALKARTEAMRTLQECKHLLLDEVQDLVGVRADFALALLSVLSPGLTVFGDSAQGIYDFQLKEGSSTTTSAALLEGIRHQFPDIGPPLKLTKNFRVGGNARLDNIGTRGRALLLESPEKAKAFLEQEFALLSSQGDTKRPQIDESLLNRSSCVVCRTNGQVLQLAGELRKASVPFQIAKDRSEVVVPPWPGTLFLGWEDDKVRREPFVTKAKEVLGLPEDTALKLWTETLAAIGQRKAISFSFADLRAALSEGAVLPDPAEETTRPDVVQLTTIHRSKGREFENVIVVMNPDVTTKKGEDAVNAVAEPRVLFVALTRAKRSLHSMMAKHGGERLSSERWIRSYTMQSGFRTLSAIEVGLAKDISIKSFVEGDSHAATKQQALLRKLAKPGAAAELWLTGKDGGCPQYALSIEGKQVGRMSPEFGWALWHSIQNLLGRSPRRFPTRIVDVWVRSLTTAVGDQSSDGVDRSLLTSGLWLVPTLEGLGRCDWS